MKATGHKVIKQRPLNYYQIIDAQFAVNTRELALVGQTVDSLASSVNMTRGRVIVSGRETIDVEGAMLIIGLTMLGLLLRDF